MTPRSPSRQKMKKIAIVGVTGARNRGVEALVVSTILGLRQQFGAVRVTIVTEDADFDRWRFAGEPDVAVLPSATCLFGSVRWRPLVGLMLLGIGRLSQRRRAVLEAIKDADLVVLSGGDMLSSDYSTRSLRRSLDWAHIAAALGVKCCALGQSIGPFRGHEHERLWTSAAERFDLVTYRESRSYAVLAAAPLPQGRRHEVTADCAFLLPRLEGEAADRLAGYYGLQEGSRAAVVVPSVGICRYGKQDAAAHTTALVTLVERLLATGVERVLLIPHVSENQIANDDSLLAQEIARRLGYPDRVGVVSGTLNAVEFKTIIARAQFVIAERMHAAIAGLSSGVPTIVIGYSIKAIGIISDVLGEELGSKCVISIADFNQLSPEKYLDKFLASAPEIGATLRKQAADLQARAARNFELLESNG